MWLPQGKRLGLGIGRDSGFFSILRIFLAMYIHVSLARGLIPMGEKKGKWGRGIS